MILNFGISIEVCYYCDCVEVVKVFKKKSSVFIISMLCSVLNIIFNSLFVFDKLFICISWVRVKLSRLLSISVVINSVVIVVLFCV